MTEPTTELTYQQQVALNRQTLVAQRLTNWFGHRLKDWPEDPDGFFGAAADGVLKASDHADAAHNIGRVDYGIASPVILDIVGAIADILAKGGDFNILLIRGGGLTGWGEQVRDAIADTIREAQ